MIKKISGHAHFKTPDVRLVVDFQPKDGITAVVGENGAGKTFTAQESLRYLLYGSKALRGTLSTYRELDLKGEVIIHGLAYFIERSLKAAQLTNALGEVLAVGQEEVSKVVEATMGYGLDVFDLCNASLQNQQQNLGDLTAGRRKEVIDRVLKVTDVRTVEKALRDEANGLRREASALVATLPVFPEVPIKPKGYVRSEDLEQALTDARDLRRQRDSLTSQIVSVSLPDEPVNPRPDEAELLADEEINKTHEALEGLIVIGSEPLTETEIAQSEEQFEWDRLNVERGPKPSMNPKTVGNLLAVWNKIETIKALPDVDAECPKCDHKFRTRPDLPAEPDHTKAELLVEEERAKKWRVDIGPDPLSPRILSPSEAQRARDRRAAWDLSEATKIARDKLAPKAHDIDERKQTLADWRAYDNIAAKKQRVDVDNAMIQRQLDDMPEVADTDQLNEKLAEARAYEQKLVALDEAEARFEELQATIVAKQEAADAYLDGNKMLSEARSELKAFLAPALSREASEMLTDMTNGVLEALIIDEDMDITVDGQPLETLSGAGKTVANLALRLALLRVLTGSAFPVFIGDELDGDMDERRREATTQAMASLKQHLQQIILITHKDVDIADHVVELEL